MDRSWQQLGNLVSAVRPPREGDTFELVIVGAGLAGLTAAYELRAYKPLVLERAPRIGGRILTHTQHGVSYDLGAVFAPDARSIPFDLPLGDLVIEPARLGLCAEGALLQGGDVMECCAGLGLDSEEWTGLARFAANPTWDAAQLPPRVYRALNAFFQVIYPGELREYAPRVQHEAFITFSPFHYARGNQMLVTELAQHSGLVRNEQPTPRMRLGATVREIADEAERVRVMYDENDTAYTIYARAVIVTTPAPITRALVKTLDADAELALDKARYESGIVVALGLRGATLPELGCVVTPDAPCNTIFLQHTSEPALSVLLVYYAGAKAQQAAKLDDAALVNCTRDTISTIFPLGEVLFSDVQRWAQVGPVMDAAALRLWQIRAGRLSPRVVLGGELAANVNSSTVPYGMSAALDGGRRAAAHAARIVAENQRVKQFAARYLVDASIYHFTNDAPQYVEHRSEGNIAFYGLILQATRDEALRKYLLGAAQDGLWEYQNGFGVTAEDSALVLEGLLECEADIRVLRAAAAKLVEQFYRAEPGAFETVHGGRAPYWRGASVDASAHIGYLLWRIAPDRFDREIRACAAFVGGQQESNGLWQGKWFPSRMVTSFYAVRLLTQFGYADGLARAQAAILAQQTRQGDWNGSVIETSAALRALQASGATGVTVMQAHERGQDWILSHKTSEGWRGEPVLYYWYELDDGTRLFYHCADKGQVTSAWATLALRD